jgi:hypothetical protein
VPNELETAIPFFEDYTHATYEKHEVEVLHKALLSTQNLLTQFRLEFKGKCSPVHFFLGQFPSRSVTLFGPQGAYSSGRHT